MYFHQRRQHTVALLTVTSLSFAYSSRAFIVNYVFSSFETLNSRRNNKINYQNHRKQDLVCTIIGGSSRRHLPLPWKQSGNTCTPMFLSTFRSSIHCNSDSGSSDNSSSNNSNSSINNNVISSSIFGGDYAGQIATFSNMDGSLIRVPEQYVPESLMEWGQIPGCLEVIVSEDLEMSSEEVVVMKTTGGQQESCYRLGHDEQCLTRTTVTVLPEVGCGIDNLDTLKKKDEIPMEWYKTFEIDRYQIATCCLVPKSSRSSSSSSSSSSSGRNEHEQSNKYSYRTVECIFASCNHDPTLKKKQHHQSNNMDIMYRTRVRVFLKHDCNEFYSCSMPIEIIQERKTSENSSRGNIADGGGLDARTVMQLVGKDKMNKPFCEENVPTPSMIASMMNGQWQTLHVCGGERPDSNNEKNSVKEYNHQYWNGCNGNDIMTTTTTTTTTTTFMLPGNILLRKCNDNSMQEQTLELCLLEMDLEDNDDVNSGGMPHVTRRVVVKYNFQKGDEKNDPIVQCVMEQKIL